jgi:uncharacterized protein with beta-barrel porin domain
LTSLVGGGAALTNSGSIGQNVFIGVNDGYSAITNTGSIGLAAVSLSAQTGNSALINSGSIGQYAMATANVGSAALTNSGSIGGYAEAFATTGNATFTNSGSIGQYAFAVSNAVGNATLFNSGTVGQFVESFATIGNATLTNSGSVGQYLLAIAINGNATIVNSGTVNQYVSAEAGAGGNTTVINSGTISQGVRFLSVGGGSSRLVNSGVIDDGPNPAIQFATSPDTITLLPGSFIVGNIQLGGISDTININAGNQNLTFNTLAGASISGSVPYVVLGNRIVSIGTTGFATTDRTLMAFTGAVSGIIGGRSSDAAAASGGALGFVGASDVPSYVDDAFAQVMGYAKAPDAAIAFKNPTTTLADGTTVWARGFYGQRTQQADGPILRNVTSFYGGAIGVDGLARPDLRLGGFVGGGATATAIDLNSGTANSDIGFAGFYGRKDIGNAFVDFALLGGYTGNRTTRNVNNNLLANGLETATASFGGWFVSPEVAAGYRFALGSGWSVTPTARLRYLAAGYDGYTETGSTADLTVGTRRLQNTEERGDLTLTHTVSFANADRLSTSTYAGILGQQRIGDGGVNAILLGQALAFATPGRSSIAGAYGGFGMEWRTGRGVSWFASAEYTAMTDLSNTVTGRAGFRVGF